MKRTVKGCAGGTKIDQATQEGAPRWDDLGGKGETANQGEKFPFRACRALAPRVQCSLERLQLVRWEGACPRDGVENDAEHLEVGHWANYFVGAVGNQDAQVLEHCQDGALLDCCGGARWIG